jgi:hypothetical protein
MIPLSAGTQQPLINWGNLAEILLFALVAGAIVVGAFSFGLVSLDRFQQIRVEARTVHLVAIPALLMALLCLGVCVAAVGLGLWAIVIK